MKKHLFIAAAAVVALASCTTSDEFFDPAQETAQQELNDNAITFGTYMGNQVMTRSGYKGNISTTELKGAAGGFGVFAYYTGNTDYESYRATTGEKYPNFMYNQNVTWSTGTPDYTGYVGADGTNKWVYSPLKYWPNDIATTDKPVDDQSLPATGSATYGGKLSFFAYAPYVAVSSQATPTGVAGASVADATYGIIALSGNKYSGGDGRYSDPFITYLMKDDGTDVVDLLWGTSNMTTTVNVLGAANNGVASTATTVTPWATSETDYTDEILKGYKTAADITKEKTQGTVDFAFKHALAKVGGSEKNSVNPSGASHHGLMIITDIDNQKGAEVGGHRGTTAGVDNNTKVTVKEITIVAKSKVNDGTNDPGQTGYTDTYLKKVQGLFNLATGKWEVTRTISTANDNVDNTVTGLTHKITTSGAGTGVAAKLNSAIAEPTTAPEKTESGFDGLTANVPDNAPLNVYDTTNGDANPLVFIPGTWPELTVTVEYCVRTKDGNLADAYSEVWQKITKKITFTNPVELNKQYNLLIHLGLTSVKFTATVSNWDVETGGTPNIDTDGDGTPDLQGTEIYVPINVAP